MKKYLLIVMATLLYSCTKENPKEITNSLGMTFVYVDKGSFIMGDEFGDGFEEELPKHQVKINSFYIGKYEVKQEEWLQINQYNPSPPSEWWLHLNCLLLLADLPYTR